MIAKYFNSLLFTIAVSLALFQPVQATVVRMDIAIGDQSTGEVYIELYDAVAPITVANFLNYIDDGNGNRRYDGTFFHRSVNVDTAGIGVIQGGGFKYINTEGASGVVADGTIVNEYLNTPPNTRGTIAMARLGPRELPEDATPDEIAKELEAARNSATSQWFINVIDNSSALPDYAVFGRILGNSMVTVDAIAALTTYNLNAQDRPNGPFPNVPTADSYTPGTPPTKSDLVVLTRVTASPYPLPLFVDPAPYDFGPVVVNTGPVKQTVTLRSVGDDALTLGIIDNAGELAGTSFTIDTSNSDSCMAGQILTTESPSCTFTILFDPPTIDSFQGRFDIPFNNGTQNIRYDISGTGAPKTPTLEVTPLSSVNFGNVAFADFSEQRITVRNVGGGTLYPVTGISNENALDFTVTPDEDCPDPVALKITESCFYTARFTASTMEPAGRTTTLTITDSLAGQSAEIQLLGNVVESQADLNPPNLNGEDAIDIGDTQVGTPVSLTNEFGGLPFGNQGTEDLIFSGFEITGADANDFGIINNTCQRVSAGQWCSVGITFDPSSLGVKSAVLEIRTNDPDTPIATLPLAATASSDSDGVADAVEAAGPNNGDGNRDGIPDILQANVTSLPGSRGGYVTLESDVGTRLTSVRSGNNPSTDPLPTAENASLSFPNGFFSFAIEDIPNGGSATVTLYLPEDQMATNTYFKYSHWFRTPTGYQFNPQNWLWDLFDFDPQTRTGTEFRENRVILHYVDGQRGDNDGEANGRIEDPGGPAIAMPVNSSSSSGGCSLPTSTGRTGIPVDLVLILLGLLLKWAVSRHKGRQRCEH